MTKSQIDKLTFDYGLFANVPRFLRTAVRRRLRDIEADDARFDHAAVRDRARLKRLYALLHVAPSPRAQASLFAKAPAGSSIAAIRKLASTKRRAVQADIIRQHQLPYLVVESALGTITPRVAEALVETLEPRELIARLPLLHRRGLLEDGVRDALIARLRQLNSTPSLGVTYQQVESVIRRAELDREVSALAMALVDTRSVGSIAGDTAIFVDASASMARTGSCLELAAQVASRLDSVMDAGAALHVVAFAREAHRVDVARGSDIGQWRAALCMPASDLKTGTSVGVALRELPADAPVRRIVIVTDGYENRPPRLASAMFDYRERAGRLPALYLVEPDTAGPQLAIDLKNAQIPHDTFRVDRHLLGLDALVAQLSTEHREDVFDVIRAYPIA